MIFHKLATTCFTIQHYSHMWPYTDRSIQAVSPELHDASVVRENLRFEEHLFWTYSLKYCNNPRPHLFGSLPCCYGLKIVKGGVDPRDIFSLPS